MEILPPAVWQQRADAHAERVDVWVQPYLARRQVGARHPVQDFLFTYYSQRPAALRRWHPGWGVGLLDATLHSALKGYRTHPGHTPGHILGAPAENHRERSVVTVSAEHLRSQVPLLDSIQGLLTATAGRPPTLGCFGLHEWAMVHRTTAGQGEVRHDWPLRLGGAGTDEVVERHRITCSHFDAFRFFTGSARPLNTLQPGREDRASYEQPGCLHAGMDLYKHAFRLTPLVPSELVADCFALAWDIRELDMRASPYDFTEMGLDPVCIEEPAGKHAYVAAQRAFAERGAPLRQQLIDVCARLRAAARTG